MHERFAVVFRDAASQAAGSLEVEQDRLLLRGRGGSGELELEILFLDLSEIRVGCRPSERLNGYPTLLLERKNRTAVQVAPLGVALLPEIADLLVSLTQARRTETDVLAVAVPLKPGCLDRARKLLAKGPPLDPASLGLSGHEVYLCQDEAIFVFRGSNAHTRLSKAARHPAVWRAGLAWQRCFAAPPHIIDTAEHTIDAAPAYRWTAPQPTPTAMNDRPTLTTPTRA